MKNSVTHLPDSQTGHDDISPNTGGTETHFKLSSLMGHFQPTPQNSCRAVIMMPLPVTECVTVFIVTLSVVVRYYRYLSPHPQIFLYDCTEVSPFSLLFFGGDITIQKDEDQETVAVDQWIVFRSPARIAHLVKVSELHTRTDTGFLLRLDDIANK